MEHAIHFVGSEIYRGSSYGERHPLAIPRVPVATDLIRALGWLKAGQSVISPRAKPLALQGFHTAQYVAAVQAAEAAQAVDAETMARYGLGTLSNPVFAEMFRRPATAAGGSLWAATQLGRAPGVVFNPGGGTHHGMADRANGFCYFNDPVLAILQLRAQGLRRVAYVDIDAHHCDGVEAGLAGQQDICLISVHEERRWPFTGALTDTAGGIAYNLPVPKGFHDDDFMYVLNHLILPAVQRHRPNAIVLQCGADAVAEDPLARLALSNRSHCRAAKALMGVTDRLLVLGGGGYNPWTCGRLWAAVWGELNGHEMPDRLPDAAQSIQRRLSWSRKGRPDERLLTTLQDAPRNGQISDEVRQRVATLSSRLVASV